MRARTHDPGLGRKAWEQPGSFARRYFTLPRVEDNLHILRNHLSIIWCAYPDVNAYGTTTS